MNRLPELFKALRFLMVLIIVASSSFAFPGQRSKELAVVSSASYQPLRDCLAQHASAGVYSLASRRFNSHLPDSAFPEDTPSGPYYVFIETERVPSTRLPETHYSFYDDEGLRYCLKRTDAEQSHPTPLAELATVQEYSTTRDGITLTIHLPREGKRSSRPQIYDSILHGVPFALFNAAAADIVALQRKYGTNTCITCLHDIAGKYDIDVTVITHSDGTLVFELRKPLVNANALYKYSFVVWRLTKSL